jgi:hypothetical protein
MNWEAVGALGEIIGAGAVVLTLVYLAAQIRHNTRATNAQSAREALAAMRDYNKPMMTDPAMARLFQKGAEGAENLDDAERSQFGHVVFNMLKTAEHLPRPS